MKGQDGRRLQVWEGKLSAARSHDRTQEKKKTPEAATILTVPLQTHSEACSRESCSTRADNQNNGKPVQS